MRGGVLGVVSEGRLEEIADHRSTGTMSTGLGEETVVQQLDVADEVQVHLGHGDDSPVPREGKALEEEADTGEVVVGHEDGISITEKSQVEKTFTEFVAVPGGVEEGFVISATSAGTFVFDYLAWLQDRSCTVSPVVIDLESFYRAHEDATYHRYGWDGLGPTETGVTWSDTDVRDDEDLDDLFAEDSRHPTQLGLSYADETLRIVLTESGYVEVYNPSDMETSEFVEFIDRDILPHATPQSE